LSERWAAPDLTAAPELANPITSEVLDARPSFTPNTAVGKLPE
jgi:hypothetical protein